MQSNARMAKRKKRKIEMQTLDKARQDMKGKCLRRREKWQVSCYRAQCACVIVSTLLLSCGKICGAHTL